MAIAWASTAQPAIQDIGFSSSSATFSSASIGTAPADRIVVVLVGSSNGYPTGLTIGGSAATLVAKSQSDGSRGAAIYYLAVSSGTTADIVLTCSAVIELCGIHVGALTGANSTEDNSQIHAFHYAADPHSFSTDPTIPTGGIGLYVIVAGDPITVSESPGTSDGSTSSSARNTMSIWSGYYGSAGTWSISWTGTNYNGDAAVALGWGAAAGGANPKGVFGLALDGPMRRVVYP